MKTNVWRKGSYGKCYYVVLREEDKVRRFEMDCGQIHALKVIAPDLHITVKIWYIFVYFNFYKQMMFYQTKRNQQNRFIIAEIIYKNYSQIENLLRFWFGWKRVIWLPTPVKWNTYVNRATFIRVYSIKKSFSDKLGYQELALQGFEFGFVLNDLSSV